MAKLRYRGLEGGVAGLCQCGTPGAHYRKGCEETPGMARAKRDAVFSGDPIPPKLLI